MNDKPINPQARQHIKALAAEGKQLLEDEALPEVVQLFVAGFLGALAISVRVLDGDDADQALDFFENQLHAVVGKAFLDGKLSVANLAKTVAGQP